ncbi:hypothetical protein ACP275_10G037500 [Erythranthe tilingii]
MWSFHTHRRKTTTSTPIFLLFPTSSLYEDVGRTKFDMFINFCNLLVQTTLILDFFFHYLSWCTGERRMRKKNNDIRIIDSNGITGNLSKRRETEGKNMSKTYILQECRLQPSLSQIP